MTSSLTQAVRWNSDALVAAIAQDAKTGKILMQAWMNAEALEVTQQEGYVCYWSRSRQSLWRKGESSGHRQKLVDMRLDCDGDSVLVVVEQEGGIACHTGRESCFYRQFQNGEWVAVEPILKSSDEIYG